MNPKPVNALGAPRLIATQANPLPVDSTNPNWVEGKELYSPTAIAIDNSTNPPEFISATRETTESSAGTQPNLRLGRPPTWSWDSRTASKPTRVGPNTSSARGLNAPTGLAVDASGNLYVADSNNNRVLRFPTPLASGQLAVLNPDLIVGQTGLASNLPNQNGVSASSLSLASLDFPSSAGLVFDAAGSLYVSDVNNNRVLVYPASVLTAGNVAPPASLVFGQPGFNWNARNATWLTPNAFANPNALAIDFKGRLYVGDALSRVLVFLPPFIVGSSAFRIAGISTTAPLGYVQGLAIAGDNLRLVAVDASNSRAFIYDPLETWPDPTVAVSPSPKYLIGQAAYSADIPNRGLAEPDSSTLNRPFGAAVSATELFIADAGNNRVLVYPIQNGVPASTASRVIGQLAANFNAPNIIEGREFNLVSASRTGSAVVDRSSNPPHLYVADPGNNRVLCFRDSVHVKKGDVADFVLGQPDVYRAVINYPSGLANTPSATGLFLPVALALDNNANLWVADSGNGRVLRFPVPFMQPAGNMPSADVVIGQSNFTSRVLNPSSTTMSAPHGLAFTSSGGLLASDLAHNRVLYFPQPLSTGMAAAGVMGQSDFNSAGPTYLNGPRGIATDAGDRIYVCDFGNRRVAVYSQPTLLPVLSLATGLSQPVGIAVAPAAASFPGEIWVADAGRNAISHYPPFSQLAASSAPDYSFPANRPLSVAFDSFYNLVAADGTNRVLFYASAVAVVNGANYLPRAASPGSIVSIFPSLSGNFLAAATASFNSLPLPVFLGDTQVLVNGQPADLFYVSPSQINVPLSLGLPSSGTLDLRVTSRTTGQIYGAADIAVAPASPGLFTVDGTGSGQVAALNDDNSINGPGNPLIRGHVLQLFATGQGPVSNPPPDGMAASASPLSLTVASPQVFIGSVAVNAANVQFSGLAPGLVGVWQINVLVPTTVTAGTRVPITVSLDSLSSNDPANLASIRTTIALQ